MNDAVIDKNGSCVQEPRRFIVYVNIVGRKLVCKSRCRRRQRRSHQQSTNECSLSLSRLTTLLSILDKITYFIEWGTCVCAAFSPIPSSSSFFNRKKKNGIGNRYNTAADCQKKRRKEEEEEEKNMQKKEKREIWQRLCLAEKEFIHQTVLIFSHCPIV